MKILQVFADWKWTGPSEPILLQTRALMDRGNEVMLSVACPPKDTGETESIVSFAGEMGIRVDGSVSWDRKTKPGNLFGIPTIMKDTKALRRLIDDMPAEKVPEPMDFLWGQRGSITQLVAIMAHHEADHAAKVGKLKSIPPEVR